MCWILAVRDSVLFLLGTGLIVKELLSGNPDPTIVEIGAGLTGIPAWLHTRHLGRTDSTPEPIALPQHSDSQSSESSNSSGGEQ